MHFPSSLSAHCSTKAGPPLSPLRLALPVLALLVFWTAPAAAEKITATTYAREPLVYDYQGKFEGFYIDLWANLAKRMGVTDYDFKLVDSPEALKKLVAEGKVELAFNGVEATDALGPDMALSFPFLDVDMRIMVPSVGPPPPERVLRMLGRLFFSKEAFYIVAALFGLALLAGFTVFRLEKRVKAQRPDGVDSLFHGLWWAIETLTSVGYGDFRLRAKLSKMFGIVFMLIGTCLFAVVVSVLTANLTIGGARSSIRDIGDLRGKRVATEGVDTEDPRLASLRIVPVHCRDLTEAAEAVLAGKADCVVGPAPLLNWYLQTQGGSDFMLVGKSLHHAFFGFAVNTRRLDVNKLNQAILGLLRDNELDPIIQKWFGKD